MKERKKLMRRMIIKHRNNTTRLLDRTAAGGSYGASTLFCSRLLRALLAILLLFNQTVVVFAFHDQEVKVGVVVNTEAELGKIGLGAINMSLSDFYSTGGAGERYKTRLVLHVRDSPNNDVVASAAAALDLIKNEKVGAIIGPETSQEAQFIINLGDKAQVPIISYSASSPHLSSIASSNYFIQATQNDSAQVQAITSIIQAFGWRQVVPVYVNDEFGGGVIPFLTDALQQKGIQIPYRSFITSSPTDDQIEIELYKLLSMDTRVFIVHMDSSLGVRVFAKANEIGMVGKDYVWIVTTGIGNGLDDLSAVELRCMQGVVGVRANVKDTWRVRDFEGRWKRRFMKEHPGVLSYPKMNVYGLWAYDAVQALATAVEKVGGGSNITFRSTSNISEYSNSLSTTLISLEKLLAGPKLLVELGRTKFDGLSGTFKLIDGILESSTLEIVNVIGNGEKTVGFWTPPYGLAKELDSKLNKRSSILKENLGLIIWPGDSTSPPKGWVQPVNNQNKFKALVPVKYGFTQFVGVSTNPTTKETKFTGYCIDIFDAVMKSLPYPVSYEYVAHDRKPTASYDELITEVYLQKADIIVGDITIVANRSKYVDFTLPFTESGVNMLVPIKDNNAKKALIFLRPLSWDLWVATFCFFVFIAFSIWVLEHRINPHFRGPPRYQAGTSLYYSFSTMVFSNNQQVYSNLTRLVVIVWIVVVIILTQSYTASFTSMLTVDQLQPTVTDVNELIKLRQYVGYQEGSFIKDLLLRMNFKESQLKPYRTVEEIHQLFSKGSENGGVSAIFDEIPFLKIFLVNYCSKYMMVPPTYKTAGIGFAFPIGSPLVDDVSRAVLNVTESEVMTKIEKFWIGDLDNCPSSSTSTNPSSTSLGLESFWVLFTIAGFVTFLALVIFFAIFLHQHRHVWLHSDPNTSVSTRIKKLAEIFDQKNVESHTFKKPEVVHDLNHVDASTANSTRCPPSPSSFTNPSEVHYEAYTDQSTIPSPSVPISSTDRLQHDDEVVVLEMPNVK